MIYCIQSKALKSFFNLVPNVDFIVVEDYETFKMFMMESSDVKEFMKIMQAHPDFRDLGDSRKFDSSEQLIEKLNYAQHSRMYIGSSCSWSKIAVKCDANTYPFVNMQYFKPYRSRLDLITHTLLGCVKF